jgi:hypothetical protein
VDSVSRRRDKCCRGKQEKKTLEAGKQNGGKKKAPNKVQVQPDESSNSDEDDDDFVHLLHNIKGAMNWKRDAVFC